MNQNPFSGDDNHKLVERAGMNAPETEMMRRLITALENSKESADQYNKSLIFFTVLLFVLGLAQFVLTIIPFSDSPYWARLVGLALIIASIPFGAVFLIKQAGIDKI